MTEILSYGGGTQTVAMCVLVAQGKLPRPDYVIAADTGREMPSTWEYADRYMRPLLASVGLELHIAPHTLATVDVWAGNGDLLVPAYTPTGKLPTFCSDKWKASVVRRYARRVLGTGADLTNWIGFSLDEMKRVKGEEGRRYPLIDLMLTKADCEAVILAAGLPLPRKAAAGCVRTSTTRSGGRCAPMLSCGGRRLNLTPKSARTTSAAACSCIRSACRWNWPTLTPTTARSRIVSVRLDCASYEQFARPCPVKRAADGTRIRVEILRGAGAWSVPRIQGSTGGREPGRGAAVGASRRAANSWEGKGVGGGYSA